MEVKKLESLRICMKNGVAKVEVNGKDISSRATYLNVTFDDGIWSLAVSKDSFYSTNNQNIKDNATSTNSST